MAALSLDYVNLLETEAEREQPVLLAHGPRAGKAEALAQSQIPSWSLMIATCSAPYPPICNRGVTVGYTPCDNGNLWRGAANHHVAGQGDLR